MNLLKIQSVNRDQGFTLMEVLIVIGILAILASIVFVSINPSRQFAQARDTQRLSHVNTILNAIVQNMIENKGIFTCNGDEIILPEIEKTIKSDVSDNGINLYDCLIPKYIPVMPYDPKDGFLDSISSYDTSYKIMKTNSEMGGRIIVTANAEIEENLPIQAIR